MVNDLFEKRSSNYSDRPRMPMLLEKYVISKALDCDDSPTYYHFIIASA